MPSPSPERSAFGWLLAAAWTVLLIAVLLWTAVWIVEQIWPWLVGFVLLLALVASLR